jgi:dihydrofolate reductase
MEFAIIVASCTNGGIGYKGGIPWSSKLPLDMVRFRKITRNTSDDRINVLIMGRITWQSLPKRPLPGRINIVVSKSMSLVNANVDNLFIARSLNHAHLIIKEIRNADKVFVIGGSELYKEALLNHRYTRAYVTIIDCDFECDTFFPIRQLVLRYDQEIIHETGEENSIKYAFFEYNQTLI